jgi:Outer membrane lipoprotein-sorting protein
MRMMRAAITLLVLAWLPCAAVAAPADLGAVLAGTRQRIETADFRATGRLVKVGGKGDRTSYKLTIKAHWFPDGLRLLCEITDPATARTRLLLHMSVNGHMTIDVVRPGSRVASALPFEHWSDPLLGTDFTYEDMLERQFFWKDQELLATAKYGARDCFVLKSIPAAEDRSDYGSVTTWIDRDIFYPVHTTKTVRGTGQEKDFTY